MQRNVHCKIVVCQVISVVNDEIYTKLKLPNLKEIITLFKNLVKNTIFWHWTNVTERVSSKSVFSYYVR